MKNWGPEMKRTVIKTLFLSIILGSTPTMAHAATNLNWKLFIPGLIALPIALIILAINSKDDD